MLFVSSFRHFSTFFQRFRPDVTQALPGWSVLRHPGQDMEDVKCHINQEVFGFSSSKHVKMDEIWRAFGFWMFFSEHRKSRTVRANWLTTLTRKDFLRIAGIIQTMRPLCHCYPVVRRELRSWEYMFPMKWGAKERHPWVPQPHCRLWLWPYGLSCVLPQIHAIEATNGWYRLVSYELEKQWLVGQRFNFQHFFSFMINSVI